MNITFTVALMPYTCPECGGVYAFSEGYYNEAQRLGGFEKCWTCPYCKTERGFGGPSEVQKAKDMARRAEIRELAQRERAEHLERQRRGYKAAKTRVMNKIAKGLCPCCGKKFDDLAGHMAERHPDYAKEDA